MSEETCGRPKHSIGIRIGQAVRVWVLVAVIALAFGAAAVLVEGAVGAKQERAATTVADAVPSRVTAAIEGDTGVDRAHPETWLPADFHRQMGYRPIVESVAGIPAATKQHGGCSSPVGDAGEPVGAACRAHDFGYDLLRYADRTGQRVDPGARHAIDSQFAHDMARGCGADRGCGVVAGAYRAAVWVNSVREGWAAPVPVSALAAQREAAGLGAFVGLAGLAAVGIQPWRTGSPTGRLQRLPAAVLSVSSRFSRAGVVGLLAGAALAWMPGLLPRGPLVQVGLTAVLALQGYVVGWGLSALARRIPARLRPTARGTRGNALRRSWSASLRPLIWSIVAGLVVLAAAAGTAGQARVAAAAGVTPPGIGEELALGAEGVGLALLLGGLAVGGGRLAGAGVRMLRRIPGRTAVAPSWRGVAAMAMVPVLALTVTAGQRPAEAASPAGAAIDGQQRRFLATRVPAETIESVTSAAAIEPIRVYVPESAGAGPERRAALAVQQLERTGAFDRSVLMLVTPTGTGWVNPAAADALEYLTGGDCATVAVQYDTSSSFVAFFTGGTEAAAAQADALYRAVHRHWLELPARNRPQLLEYGESLGALGGLEAPSIRVAPSSVRRLWVGVPGPARHALGARGEVVLEHDDDPVSAWSPSLLAGPNGRNRTWLPVVSFWSASGDLVNAIWAPTGHGHRYSSELAGAMRRALGHGAETLSPRATSAIERNLADIYASTS